MFCQPTVLLNLVICSFNSLSLYLMVSLFSVGQYHQVKCYGLVAREKAVHRGEFQCYVQNDSCVFVTENISSIIVYIIFIMVFPSPGSAVAHYKYTMPSCLHLYTYLTVNKAT